MEVSRSERVIVPEPASPVMDMAVPESTTQSTEAVITLTYTLDVWSASIEGTLYPRTQVSFVNNSLRTSAALEFWQGNSGEDYGSRIFEGYPPKGLLLAPGERRVLWVQAQPPFGRFHLEVARRSTFLHFAPAGDIEVVCDPPSKENPE